MKEGNNSIVGLKRIGITGGIGSGKTTVCHIFESLGIPVYYSDLRGRFLLEHDMYVKDAIRGQFGHSMYVDGVLDRKRLAKEVFSFEDKLRKLEAIVHPSVQRDFEVWYDSQTHVDYILKEAALLYESGSFATLDKMIVVTAPLEVRIERVMIRDDVSRSLVMKRIEKQWPQAKKVELADYVIDNSGEEELIPQVLKIHQKLVEDSTEEM